MISQKRKSIVAFLYLFSIRLCPEDRLAFCSTMKERLTSEELSQTAGSDAQCTLQCVFFFPEKGVHVFIRAAGRILSYRHRISVNEPKVFIRR